MGRRNKGIQGEIKEVRPELRHLRGSEGYIAADDARKCVEI